MPASLAQRDRDNLSAANSVTVGNRIKSKQFLYAGVAKLADAQDLKSWVRKRTCGFDSRPRHHLVESDTSSTYGPSDDAEPFSGEQLRFLG